MTMVTSVSAQPVSITARDGRLLDGLLYEPVRPIASVLHLHGKGGNCLGGPARFVPAGTAGLPLRHLGLNMRCHDLGYTRNDVASVDFHHGDPVLSDGGCWERLSDGPLDVQAGVEFLRDRGPEPVFVSGHSSGGFYAATYGALDDGLAGRIMLSPLVSNKRPLELWFDGADGLRRALAEAERMIGAGDGDLLIPLPSWYYAISANSLLERAAEKDDVWLDAVQASASPLLMLWGSAESRAPMWQELFGTMAVPGKQMLVIDGAPHSYQDFEQQVSQAIAEFVLGSSR